MLETIRTVFLLFPHCGYFVFDIDEQLVDIVVRMCARVCCFLVLRRCDPHILQQSPDLSFSLICFFFISREKLRPVNVTEENQNCLISIPPHVYNPSQSGEINREYAVIHQFNRVNLL